MENFKKQYARLNPEQKKAVDTIDGPVLVIAGPGTGKTQLLSVRTANILLSTDAQAHNILCLTFTESAAYEMRERLINIIGQAAYNITISTYHAFGSELLRRFPEYFNELPGERAIDELGIINTINTIVDNLPYSNALKKSGFYLKDIVGTISECKRALIKPDHLRKVADANQEFIKNTSKITKRELKGIVRISKKSLPTFEKLLGLTKPQKSPDYVVPGVLSLAESWHEQLGAALEKVEETQTTKPITQWKNNWLARDTSGQFIVSGEQTAQKLRALADIYEQYLSELERQGTYDYDDMILRATKGLEDNKDLRYTLQEQYAYIMLDEFQDTNAAQLKLVSLLCDSPLYEQRPNILAVGDDDQAIYAFQGASYSHMLAFQQMFKDTVVVNLSVNYRSHHDVLHVAHGIAQQIEERLHHNLEGINKVLKAEADISQATIQRHEFKSDLAQYAWITKRVTQLIEQGTSPSEIAILAPGHKYLEPIMPYLAQAKIPVRYDKRENVLDDTHIKQLLHMAKLVLALQSNNLKIADSLWPEVLSYDFWGISTSDIWELSWEASDTRTPWTKLLFKSHKLKKQCDFFLALAGLASIETLETMLDYLVGVRALELSSSGDSFSSPFYEYNFSRQKRDSDVSGFWNLLSNLTVLRQHLRDYKLEEGQQLMLSDFVDFADAHQQANIKILNTSPYHEAADAVQVMTAYKAKGMEFEHVFIVACVDEAWGSKATTQTSRVPLPPNLSFIRYKGASDDERLRLLFVAITRAKKGLYIASYVNNFANKPTTRLKYLNEVEDGTSVTSPLLPSQSQNVHQANERAPDIDDLSAFWQSRHTEPSAVKSLSSLLKPRLDRYQMAPTHLNNFTDLVFGGPEDFFLNTILKFPKAPTIDGQYGNAIHETLEWVHSNYLKTGKRPTKAMILKTYGEYLKDKPMNERDYTLLKARGEQCLTTYCEQRLAHISIDDRHEVDFKNQGVLVGDAHLSGKIDKLIINKRDKTITIVDFKTGKSFDKWKSDIKLHKYKQQLYLYKLLVEGSYEFADYSVKDAYLEFVEPDENGKIVELHVKFTLPETQRIKKLIGTVWHHIKTLDFPDVSAYAQNTKGVVSFEEDLLSGKV